MKTTGRSFWEQHGGRDIPIILLAIFEELFPSQALSWPKKPTPVKYNDFLDISEKVTHMWIGCDGGVPEL